MSTRIWVVVPAVLWAFSAFGQAAPGSAHANIVNPQGQKIGSAVFTSAPGGGVEIKLEASQLPPGVHGVHIHSVGKCEGPDFKTAGGHFNPENKQHGKNNPAGPHAGDVENIEVSAGGAARATLMATHLTLGQGPNSLFHDGGTAIVIHEKEDDYKTDPSGNSGSRIACGVIER